MPRVFVPRGGFGVRRQRRPTGWARGPNGQFTRSAAGTTVFATGAQALEDGLTVVRLRGELLVSATSVAAVTDFMSCAAGIANFPENAAGIGVSAMETPISDADWDGWIWHRFFTVAGLANNGAGFARIEVDSKAMRKVKEGDTIVGMVEVGVESGTVVLNAVLDTRMLAKLT